VLDSSASLGEEGWRAVRTFAQNFVQLLDYGLARIRIAVLIFSTTDQLVAEFDDEATEAGILARIEAAPFLQGSTQTGRAMRTAAQTLVAPANASAVGRRVGTPAVVVVVTDGNTVESGSQFSTRAQELFATGAMVYAVGAGLGVNQATLTAIANGNASNTLLLTSVEALQQLATANSVATASVCTVTADGDGAPLPTTTVEPAAATTSGGPAAGLVCAAMEPADVVLLLDSSSSMRPDEWQAMLAFASSVVSALPMDGRVRYAKGGGREEGGGSGDGDSACLGKGGGLTIGVAVVLPPGWRWRPFRRSWR
jgi:hypothetical protein